jgi:hypothetical protein
MNHIDKKDQSTWWKNWQEHEQTSEKSSEEISLIWRGYVAVPKEQAVKMSGSVSGKEKVSGWTVVHLRNEDEDCQYSYHGV